MNQSERPSEDEVDDEKGITPGPGHPENSPPMQARHPTVPTSGAPGQEHCALVCCDEVRRGVAHTKTPKSLPLILQILPADYLPALGSAHLPQAKRFLGRQDPNTDHCGTKTAA